MTKVMFLWGTIFILILLNIATLGFFLLEKKVEQNVPIEDDFPYHPLAAIVGEEEIKTMDLIHYLVDTYGENILNDMIDRRLVFQEAERFDVTIAPDEIDRQINYLGQDYASNEKFYEMLEQQMGINEERLREEILFFLLTEELATFDIYIAEEELAAYYEENMDLFYEPTRFHLHQIVVEGEEEASQIILEINQGASFAAAAAEHSLDLVTSTNGGDMGMVTSDDYFLPWSVLMEAEQIELNSLSAPILTDDGYVIIQVTERVAEKQASFEEVRSKIRRELALKQMDGLANYLQQLRESERVINNLFD